MARKKAAAAEVEPNKLVRQKAGTYRTDDQRFEVRQAGLGWFLVDTTVTDELGQEVMTGPFPTLDAVRDALPEARRTTLKPLPKPKAASSKAAKPAAKPKRKPAPPPPSWIDKLPKAEATAVRSLIAALEREGLDDAQELVRADRKGDDPVVARRLLERRLDSIAADAPAAQREAVQAAVRRAAELLTATGTNLFPPLPGWMLVEVVADTEPEQRRITLRHASERKRRP